jgi:hypothetical protein
MDGYQSFGSFAPVYTSVAQRLMEDRDRIGVHVLYAIAQHADPKGVAFPGLQRLSKLTGYAESSCSTAINRLVDLGYLRLHRHVLRSRGTEVLDYQVSPYALWIRPELVDEALTLWDQAIVMHIDTEYVQPAFEPDAVNQLQNQRQHNQLQNQHHHHQYSNGKNETAASGGKPPAQSNGHSANGRHSESTEPAANGRTPELRLLPIEQFRRKLADPADEAYAVLCTQELRTRITQARQLVASVGRRRVELALTYLRDEVRTGATIKSKAGIVKWWLANHIDDEYDTSEEIRQVAREAQYGVTE